MDSHMSREIAEIPGLLRSMASRWQGEARRLLAELEPRRNLVLVGRGSSGNVCTFAAYLAAHQSGRQPIELRPWIATQKSPLADYSDATVFAFSASGQSTDVASAAEWLRAAGAQVIGITNAAGTDTNLGCAAQRSLLLDAGPEQAVPATKSFVAQLLAAAALCGLAIEEQAAEIARCVEQILSGDASTRLMQMIQPARVTYWLARGPALAAALDAALKQQETARMPAAGYSTAEFLHGPIGGVDGSDRIVIFLDRHERTASMQTVVTRLVGRHTPFLCITGNPEAASPAELDVRVPLPSERWACAVVFAVLSQLTALRLAEARGINPDAPEGLQKVTMTL